MGDETNKVAAKFGIAKDKPVSGEQDGKTNESNGNSESGGFKQVDKTAEELATSATNDPATGVAPSNEGNTGGVADNGPSATQARLDQSEKLEPIEGTKAGGYNPGDGQYQNPTAADLGVNRESQRSELTDAFAHQAAAAAGVGDDDADAGLVIYSSHPIQNYQVGPYHFEKTVLKLNPEQAAEFDKLVAQLPLTESRNIAKIDTGRVDAIVAARMSGATKQFDSSAGRSALAALQAQNPQFGTVPIEDQATGHANLSQTDNNVEVPVNPFDAKFNDDSNG